MTTRTAVEEMRRAQIMKATRDVVCEKGFDKTTMRDIGQRVGMSAAIVCYYFEDKKRLMRETLMDACLVHRRALEGIIDRDISPLEKLDLALEDTFPMTDEQRREWRFWLDYWAEATRDEELRVPVAEVEVRFRGHLKRILAEGANRGAFRTDTEPALLGTDVAALMEGLAVAAMLDPQRITLDVALGAVHRHVLPCSSA